jgi:hypothetical protein
MFEQTPTAQQELLLARELLEYAVLFSVSQKDEAAVVGLCASHPVDP